jgi:steroid 5-alpha reductase family enzyme
MSDILQMYYVLSVVTLLYVTFWFFISLALKRNDVADIAWGVGFFLATFVTYFTFGMEVDRGLFVMVLVLVWALRLSLHIYSRNKGKKEDYRYKKWRDDWGKWFYVRTYLQVFVLQGVLMLVVVSPAIIINIYRGGSVTVLDFIGLAVWLVGFVFESVGDYQLRQFIKNPDNKGKIMNSGLWKYTRHPNYFGEVTQWWGVFIIALSVPYGYVGVVGPLLITFLILKVSGIPLLEKNMEGNPAFQEYKKRTSIFFPLPPKV